MKTIKIAGYSILYLILCLIIMPIIVNFLQVYLKLGAIASMLSVAIKVLLALQISRRINLITQVFPNYLKNKSYSINNPNLAQAICYVIYFSIIYMLSAILSALSLTENVIALIIITLIKLFVTYIIANSVRYIVSKKNKTKSA